MPGIPFFEPPFPAVTLRCQLCGKEQGSEKFITERVHSMREQARGGDYNLCPPCRAEAAEVGQKIEAFSAEIRAEAEKRIAAELPAMVRRWLAERGIAAPERVAEPETTIAKRVRTRTMIPDPDARV